MQLYCLFPFTFFPSCFLFSQGTCCSISPNPPPALLPACRGPPAHTPGHRTLAARLTACSAAARPAASIANPQSLLNPASYQANQNGWDAVGSVVQLHLLLPLHLPPRFCLLPVPAQLWRSSSLPARCIAAPACGSRGNYSDRSRRTDLKHRPRNLLAQSCPSHAGGKAGCCLHLCLGASVHEEGWDARPGYGSSSVT